MAAASTEDLDLSGSPRLEYQFLARRLRYRGTFRETEAQVRGTCAWNSDLDFEWPEWLGILLARIDHRGGLEMRCRSGASIKSQRTEEKERR